jgi:anti-sigma regulatory factor (Ser/Thr protein kinase)
MRAAKTARRAPRAWVMTFKASHEKVRLARTELRTALATWGLHHVEDSALVVLSELATNAVIHAGGWVTVSANTSRNRKILNIQVRDWNPSAPRWTREVTCASEHGRGLHIVSELSCKWGVLRLQDGKAVWAELEIPHPSGGVDA